MVNQHNFYSVIGEQQRLFGNVPSNGRMHYQQQQRRWELWRMARLKHTGTQWHWQHRSIVRPEARMAAWGRTCYQVQWQRPLMFTLATGLKHNMNLPCQGYMFPICHLQQICACPRVLCHRTASNRAHMHTGKCLLVND